MALLISLFLLAPTGHAVFVNQRVRADPVYHISLYRNGIQDVRFRLPAMTCEQVWPSAFKVRGQVWLYVAERDCPAGTWNRIVLYRGPDELHLGLVGVVARESRFHMASLAYDGRRFLLWYTRDNGAWANELVLRTSSDGVHFAPREVKDRARGWYAAGFSPAYSFRYRGRWYLYGDGFAPGLTAATPGVYVLDSPDQPSYGRLRRLVVDKSQAPKIDASIVCRRGNAWAGAFTAWGAQGDLFGFEWTLVYTAKSLLGPWRYQKPFIPLGEMISLENPAPLQTGPEATPCDGLLG